MSKYLSTVVYPVMLDGMSTETLASFVQERRAALGLKQGELAAMIGTSASYMSQIESGKTRWPHQLIPALARALGVSQVRLAVAAGLIGPEALTDAGQSDANPFRPDDIRWRIVEEMKQIDMDGPDGGFWRQHFTVESWLYRDMRAGLGDDLADLESARQSIATSDYELTLDQNETA
jgi:transcriptional regulator with XRE-family HTH domain